MESTKDEHSTGSRPTQWNEHQMNTVLVALADLHNGIKHQMNTVLVADLHNGNVYVNLYTAQIISAYWLSQRRIGTTM